MACVESASLCGGVSDAGAEPGVPTAKPEPTPRRASKQNLAPLAVLDACQTALGSHLEACILALVADSAVPPPAPLVETVKACADALRATEAAKRVIAYSDAASC